MSDCFICNKHQKMNEFCGEPLLESGGLVLSHFPQIPGEKAGKGHLLIEPRRHLLDFSEMNDDEAGALGAMITRAVRVLKSELKAEHVYLFRINDKVPHLHLHLVPRYPGTPKGFWGVKIMEWPDKEALNLEQTRALVKNLKSALQK